MQKFIKKSVLIKGISSTITIKYDSNECYTNRKLAENILGFTGVKIKHLRRTAGLTMVQPQVSIRLMFECSGLGMHPKGFGRVHLSDVEQWQLAEEIFPN